METESSVVDRHIFESKLHELIDKRSERLQDEDNIDKLKSDETSRTEATHTQDLQQNCPTTESQDQLLRDNDYRLQSINQHRSESIKCLKKQATGMLQQSCSKFPETDIGQNVLVKIPEVDRGPLAPRNVLAVVLYEKEGLYQLTSTGVLKKLYARSEFQLSETHTLASSDVPTEIF
ncbi:hypothetical protein QE152_g8209 [Popillia japonica]|uniref:Uncharacterized protein n=1 Tax=Popillia japonica TaxID=7064 RepID=A0AAW1M5C2_POPJA